MDKINIQEILPFVEMPSRYLGCEANSVKKKLEDVDIKFALAFPDLYEIGTSHFGMQILYTILNGEKHIAAERFFTPAPDMEKILQEKNLPLFSLESSLPMKAFDIIGFSLLYELNFTNILTMMHLSGIPFYAAERDENFPLIIGGGPCTFNPEPLADFFDAFVIGDGEEVVIGISNAFIEWKKSGDGVKKSLLKRLSSIQGVYIPSFFRATFKPFDTGESAESSSSLSGGSTSLPLPDSKPAMPSFDMPVIQYLEPLEPNHEKVRRAILPDISTTLFPTAPVVPFGKPVHDRLRLEVARGCSRGCRFCQAGMIYRPVRERSVDDLVAIAEESVKNTGYSDISLLSLSTGDYENLAPLMESLLAVNPGHCTALSLPSVRAGKLDAPLMKIIKSVKKTGFTIAPEAGTQRLRDVINKNITEEDIFNTVNSAFELGWRTIKLYFMNGLPTETGDDIDGIVDITRRLASFNISSWKEKQQKNIRQKICADISGETGNFGDKTDKKQSHIQHKKAKGKLKINVSFATFIPKAHTPFQRCAQITPEKAMENLDLLKQKLRHPGINLKWQNPSMSLLEGVWARGDRRLSKVLVSAWEKGCRLDGWSDMFRMELWKSAFEENNIDPLFYTARERHRDEPLPWDHIDCGLPKQFMEKEFEKAIEGIATPDCRENECNGCGICDFQTVKPVLFPPHANNFQSDGEGICGKHSSTKKVPCERDEYFAKFRLFYSKMGDARHFGHLELAKIIRRAIRRTGIKVKYSGGFSPSMKISFDNPLPVGMESEEEFFNIYAHISTNPDTLVKKINAVIPRSIVITRCLTGAALSSMNRAGSKSRGAKDRIVENIDTSYRINLKNYEVAHEDVDQFMALSEYVVEQVNFKGIKRSCDLRKITRAIDFPDPLNSSLIEMTLAKDGERTIRPGEILTEVLEIPDHVLRSSNIVKLKRGATSC
ncbi:Radical SAM domain protein [Desulfamplus magnetovallimortis]|uniref:Radical SAM domain protein n=1 Tax=Desulfamplus magnetovallimortis TaxID=1246637 RepID=A0A1W1HB89_9BACT|nr:TIGR03936 family radical SAM-associated protein [Desulfamplus magnetovallimortis]SLM29706.1 Radical SAM domain protein [Desulfamplus magnetovallimortis]